MQQEVGMSSEPYVESTGRVWSLPPDKLVTRGEAPGIHVLIDPANRHLTLVLRTPEARALCQLIERMALQGRATFPSGSHVLGQDRQYDPQFPPLTTYARSTQLVVKRQGGVALSYTLDQALAIQAALECQLPYDMPLPE
jgi:hypothetical protein